MSVLSGIGGVVIPSVIAVVIAVCFQIGFIMLSGQTPTTTYIDTLHTLEDKLKQLETETLSIDTAKGIESTLMELERKMKDVQAAIDAMKQLKEPTTGLSEKAINNGSSDKNAYFRARDTIIYLILAGLSVLQIGLITSVFFLFRTLKKRAENKVESAVTDDVGNNNESDKLTEKDTLSSVEESDNIE